MVMASHTNHAGYSHAGEDDVATPYNRPRPQWEMTRSAPAPVDPTAGLLAEGGFLTLNDRDRAGLNTWFHNSFQNSVSTKGAWFTADWFPQFFAPIRDRINKNFDRAFGALQKNSEEVTKLRSEHAAEVVKLRSEHAKEIAGLRKAFDAAELYLNGALELIDKNNKEITGLRNEMAAEIIKMHKQMASEVVKIHASVRHEMRDFISGKNKEFRSELGEMRGKTMSRLSGDLTSMKDDLLALLRGELTGELIKMRKELKPASKPTSKPASSKVKK
jgi:prefoldin subunit 5